MAKSLTDTHPKIEQMLIERLREMSPAEKLRQMSRLNQLARTMALSELRARHPEASEAELRRYLADRILGPDLAARVYGPLPESNTE